MIDIPNWPCHDDVCFEGELFIPFRNASGYLEFQDVVFELDDLYFYFKGFADSLTEEVHMSSKCYIDGMGIIDVWDGIICDNVELLFTKTFTISYGTINGKSRLLYDFNTFDFLREIDISANSVYVKQSDLDRLSESYGINKVSKFIPNGGLDLNDPAVQSEPSKNLSVKEKTTYQNIIAALLDCVNGDIVGIEKHQSFKNESELIKFIASRYHGYPGLSESNLSRKFPVAKRSLSNY